MQKIAEKTTDLETKLVYLQEKQLHFEKALEKKIFSWKQKVKQFC